MQKMKKYLGYVALVIGGMLLTWFLVFVAFNSNYKKIELIGELPEQISIEKAEATDKQVRIYGRVTNTKENNLNGKFIKVDSYNSKQEIVKTEILEIKDVKEGENKLFKSEFLMQDVKSYQIKIIDNI